MRGRRAKAIRLALDVPGRVPYEARETELVKHTRRERNYLNSVGDVIFYVTTYTERNQLGSPRSIYQRVKRGLL